MKHIFAVAAAISLSVAGVTSAQRPGHVDPGPVLRAAAKAMGVDKLRCISFSGEGYTGMVGQNVTQNTDWPKGEPLLNYTRVINFDERTSSEPRG